MKKYISTENDYYARAKVIYDAGRNGSMSLCYIASFMERWDKVCNLLRR